MTNIFDAIRSILGAQKTLTFDSVPTTSSANPVTSDGIKMYVDNTIADAITSTIERSY